MNFAKFLGTSFGKKTPLVAASLKRWLFSNLYFEFSQKMNEVVCN